MSTPKKILFVCTGNTCRSLMAEKLLDKLGRERGLALEVKSCGVAAERYFKVPREVTTVLAERGVEPFSHTAQLVTRELLKWTDIALVMTEEHKDAILEAFPEFTAKVALLGDYAGLEAPNIEDPIGQSLDYYRECCAKILKAAEAVVQKHESIAEKPRP